jgi:glycosyltransferase involved in cell wall biosynthesis
LTDAVAATRRVVVFAAHFAPHMGGVERFTQGLWSSMARRGWDVIVVTSNTNGAAPSQTMDGLRVIRLPAWQLLESRVPIPKPSPALLGLARGLLAAPPDVIVSNTRFFPTSALAALLARCVRRPLLHIEHGSAPVTLGRPIVDRLTAAYDCALGGWVLRSADRCVGVSQAVSDFLRAVFKVADAGVLPNGVATTGWDHAQTDYRARLGLHPADVLIVYAGRLIEAKGVRELLDAFGGLDGHSARRGRLAIAGVGPLAAEVERRATEDHRIAALGLLAQEQVHDLLIAADVVAHPSSYPEGLPTVLLEAAASGAAIVATPAGGTTDLIRDGENGLIVPVGDRSALVGALELLTADQALRERLGMAARRTVKETFDWEAVADALERELSAL